MKIPEDGVVGCVRVGASQFHNRRAGKRRRVCGLLMVSVESILIRDL